MTTAAAIASAFAPSSPDIASRVLTALGSWGFDASRVHLERLGSVVRIVLADGGALAARMLAAAAALREEGLEVDVHGAQRAIVAYSPIVASSPAAIAPCEGCRRGRCLTHAPLFAELDL